MVTAFFPAIAAISLPKVIFLIGLVGVLVAGLTEFRQGHIGRPAIFINALLLWQIFYSVWGTLPTWFQWYLNIGSIVGLIAIIAYLPRKKLPTEFYQFCYYVYGSFSIIIAAIVAIYLGVPLF
jgi:hypothetical protein